jgi:hypothetical protein
MNKIIQISLAAISSGVLLFFLMLPRDFSIDRSALIKTGVDEVMNQVTLSSQRLAWTPWKDYDPEAKFDFDGDGVTPGSEITFQGPRLGKGSIRLITYTDTMVFSEIEITEPFYLHMMERLTVRPLGTDRTRLNWHLGGTLDSLRTQINGVFFDHVLGSALEQGLKKLKELLESTNKKPENSAL